MAFNLKSQSPLKQDRSFNTPDKKFTEGIQSSLNKSKNKTEKVVSYKKANPAPGGIVSKIYRDLDAEHPMVKAAIQITDPTGTSSYGDVKKAWNDKKFTSDDIIEPLGAIPAIGAFGRVVKGIKTGSNYMKEAKASKALRRTNKVSNANTAVEGISSTSPLHRQKLSPKAAKAKAERDLAFAKTDERRAKKAHSQRMRRKDPKGKGKDWDHEDGRWESVKQNRGNEGEGTKKEGKKRYKIK